MEAELLSYLVDGPRRQKSIPMPKSSRFEAAVRLETRGMLLRGKDGWTLTREGLHYAINFGIMPTAKPVFDDLPSVYSLVMPRQSTPVYKSRTIVAWVLVAACAHLIPVLIMHYAGFADIW